MVRKRLREDSIEKPQNGQNGHHVEDKVAADQGGSSLKIKLMLWSTAMCCINMIFQEQLLR